jgi:hypothetical protein
MQKTRRKLIKGALAVTAVTAAGCGGGGGSGSGTPSGGASTFSVPTDTRSVSSWHLCMQRNTQEAEATQLPPLTSVDDTYLRLELQVADGLRSVPEGQPIEGQFFLDGQTYHQVINTLGVLSPATQWTTMNAEPVRSVPMYAVVRVNDFGEYTPRDIALIQPTGYVVVQSCMASVVTRVAAKYG